MQLQIYKLARYLIQGLFIFIVACSYQPTFTDIADLEFMPRQAEIQDVPFYPQKDHQCAPAALAALLNYRGLSLTPDEITPYVYLPKRKGSIAPEVLSFVRSQGLLTYPLEGDLKHLFREIEVGNPVLVLQNLSFDWIPQWHYAVVIGFDLDERKIILRSANEKRWITSFKNFENTWRRSGHWAYVLTQPENLPATATPLPVIKVALDLEEVGQLEAARIAYQSAYRAWPHDKGVLIAMGNYYYGQGEFFKSVNMFEKLTKLHPYEPDGWNNLAYSFLQLGCRQRALDAINKALQLEPGDNNLQSSKKEITESETLVDCPL